MFFFLISLDMRPGEVIVLAGSTLEVLTCEYLKAVPHLVVRHCPMDTRKNGGILSPFFFSRVPFFFCVPLGQGRPLNQLHEQ